MAADLNGTKSAIWNLIWPAVSAATALLIVFYTFVITPIQQSEQKLDLRLSDAEQHLGHLYQFEGSDLQWNTSHEQAMGQLRSDLSVAYADREKKLDRLNARLDAIENKTGCDRR